MATAKLNCSICLTGEGEWVVVPSCGHIFHRDCILRWIAHKPECPNCKEKLEKPQSRTRKKDPPVYFQKLYFNEEPIPDPDGPSQVSATGEVLRLQRKVETLEADCEEYRKQRNEYRDVLVQNQTKYKQQEDVTGALEKDIVQLKAEVESALQGQPDLRQQVAMQDSIIIALEEEKNNLLSQVNQQLREHQKERKGLIEINRLQVEELKMKNRKLREALKLNGEQSAKRLKDKNAEKRERELLIEKLQSDLKCVDERVLTTISEYEKQLAQAQRNLESSKNAEAELRKVNDGQSHALDQWRDKCDKLRQKLKATGTSRVSKSSQITPRPKRVVQEPEVLILDSDPITPDGWLSAPVVRPPPEQPKQTTLSSDKYLPNFNSGKLAQPLKKRKIVISGVY